MFSDIYQRRFTIQGILEENHFRFVPQIVNRITILNETIKISLAMKGLTTNFGASSSFFKFDQIIQSRQALS